MRRHPQSDHRLLRPVAAARRLGARRGDDVELRRLPGGRLLAGGPPGGQAAGAGQREGRHAPDHQPGADAAGPAGRPHPARRVRGPAARSGRRTAGAQVSPRPRLLVIQFEASCPPGLLADAAARAGVDLEVIATDRDQQVPGDLDDAAGLVLLGGSMDVSDAPDHPALGAAMALIRLAAAQDIPGLGICLGGQLAAHALGGRAYRSPRGPEYGWIPLAFTRSGRAELVLGALDSDVEVFSSHHDVFDLPPGADLLAWGGHSPNQAFRLGSVLGLQFHPEVDAALVAAWYDQTSPPPPLPKQTVVSDARRNAPRARSGASSQPAEGVEHPPCPWRVAPRVATRHGHGGCSTPSAGWLLAPDRARGALRRASLTTVCLGSGGGGLVWSYQAATSAASTSGWNWRPRTLPSRNAWLGEWPPQASRSAPGGRSKTSWCEENT